jgi:hypothetical protein
MKLPKDTEPTLWGAAGGAALIAMIGFGFAGWNTEGGSAALGQAQANKAIVAALSPVCAEMFKQDANNSMHKYLINNLYFFIKCL